MKYDKDLNLVGDLAESWEVSPDGLTIIHARFRGIKPALAEIAYNFICWYVPTREQRVVR